MLCVRDVRAAAEPFGDVPGLDLDPVDGVARVAPHGVRERVVEDSNGYRLAFGGLEP